MVRVAHRLARSFPWCSIALCNCIDHHRVTGLEEKAKRLAKTISRPGLQPSLPSLLLCCHTDVVPATENLWTQPAFEVVTCSMPLYILLHCVVLCCVSRQWVAQLYSNTAMCLPGHLGGRQDIRSRSPGHEKCRRPGELGLSTLSWDVDLV